MNRFRRNCFVATVACVGLAQGAEALPPPTWLSKVKIEIDLVGKPVPKWSGGGLVLRDTSSVTTPIIHLIDGHGRVIASAAFMVPGASYVIVRDAAYSPDGMIVLCGGTADSQGRAASFVAWMSRTGDGVHIVRTSPYIPSSVAIAQDGSIWTAGGFERRRSLTTDLSTTDGAIFRRFDRSGKLTGAFVPQTRLRDPAALLSSGNLFGPHGERMLWYSPAAREYIEMDANGAVTSITGLELPERSAQMSGFAIGSDGRVLISTSGNGGWSVAELDVKNRIWTPIYAGRAGRGAIKLYGAEGGNLIGWTDGTHLEVLKLPSR